jgi:CHAT domain-containing protein
MKHLTLILILIAPVFIQGQITDTSNVIAQVDSLLELSKKLMAQNETAKAMEANELAGSVIVQKLGESTNSYVAYLNRKAFFLIQQNRYDDSEQTLLEALKWGKSLSPINYISSLDYLGFTYWRMSRYEDAEKAYLEAIKVGEKSVGKENSRYRQALSHLANLYRYLGRYEEAKEFCLEVLSITESVSGKESKDYAHYLALLSNIHHTMGDFESAEKYDFEALKITKKVYGEESLDYAGSLNSIAISYISIGNYEAAEPLLLQAKEIRLKTLGRNNVYYAETIGYLGNLYSDLGKYEQAEKHYIEARAIIEGIQGKMNADYAMITNNNANLYVRMEKWEEAKHLFLEALGIREKVLGKKHRFYASTLNNLSFLYLKTNEIEKAESLLLEVEAIYEKKQELNDYHLNSMLRSLFMLYWTKGDFEEANRYISKAFSRGQTALITGSRYLSEQELGLYLNTFLFNIYSNFSFADISQNPQAAANSYDLALFYKGYLLTTSKQIRRLVNKDASTASQFDTLQIYQAQLTKEYAKKASMRDSHIINELENRTAQLEKNMVQAVAGFKAANRQVIWQQVQQTLHAGEAAVEFVRYVLFLPEKTDTVMYAAIILRPNDSSPQFVPLATESQLEAMLNQPEKKSGPYINRLYSDNESTLYQLIWQPLEQALEHVNVVYYSPVGLLHRLNLSAVSKPDETILAGHYQLIRLGSTRQLAEPDSIEMAHQDALLFGGIQYKMDSTAIFQHINTVATANLVSGTRGYTEEEEEEEEQLPFMIDASILTHQEWAYLPWTEVEIEAIDIILQDAGMKTKLKKGYAATEEAFKAMGKSGTSPRIVHLSTHGFFFPDFSDTEEEKGPTGFQSSDHPMIRSGLILAGGNYVWQNGHALRPDMEDGVLTAFEVSQMDLSNTELVVLSACETGLGDIAGNEGVYGLQRAFKIAGARYLIMSLWQVPDFQTQELMTTFYLNWLEKKMSIPQAFAEAQAAIRKKYPEPFYWAGFVLIE